MPERTLEQTPTWAVAVVCFVLVAISIVIELIIHLVGKWLAKRNKVALCEALEKIKAELMLLGFISLLLTVGQGLISEICIPEDIGATWHPCKHDPEEVYESSDDSCSEGHVPFVSNYGIHQLHIFIFVLAVSHVLYCIVTLALGTLKMRKWKSWEMESRTTEYQFSHDPERFRFARDTSFGRRHLHFWSQSPILLWTVCFFRQFITSVSKVDYLTLRHGFIIAHLAPQSHSNFNFQKYINRTLEGDFKVVVGISPVIWFCAVVFLLFYTHGWYSYFWIPFFSLVIILLVGTKLQVIITKMGVRIQDRGEVVKGTPLVQPGDDLFWFNRPRLLLHLIHFVLFQNAFQLAFFAWAWYEFGLQSCFHEEVADIVIRLSMGVIIQILCSYVTLPLYALVTQMGSTMKPTIFNDRVAKALHNWHQTARKHIKQNKASGTVTPLPSRPGTPLHGTSPVHLLRYYRSEIDSTHTSPRASNFDNEPWEGEESASPMHQKDNEQVREAEPSSADLDPLALQVQHIVDIRSSSDFSFGRRSRI